jgi:hypothetical protein
MQRSPMEKMILDFQRLRWNSLIPKHAVVVELVKSGVRWLHPTKGWKYVSARRLGFKP